MAQARELSDVPMAGPADASSSKWLFSLPLVIASYVYLRFILRGEEVLYDGDTYSHIAAGKWILENGAVPTHDPFSHTMRGAPWTAFEWLSQVVLAVSHQLAGWTGPVAITVFAFAASIALLTRSLLRSLEPIHVVLFVGLAISMTGGHVLARPHIIAMPLMMIWTIGLVRASDERRSPRLWLLPLMVIWANLHGSFTLGIAFAFAFSAEALLAARGHPRLANVVRSWGLFLLITLVCSMMTPHGPRGLWVTWQVLFQDTYALARINEWRSPNFHDFQPLELWLLGGIAVALHQGLRLPPVRLMLLLGLIHLSLKHGRYVELLGLLAPTFLAAPFASQWRERQHAKPQLQIADRFFQQLSKPAGYGAVAVTFSAFLAVHLWIAQARPISPSAVRVPGAAIQAAEAAGLKGPVLNAYEWGGYLIYMGIPPFIDGRSDMYRDAFIEEFVTALEVRGSQGLARLLDKHKISWTVLPPGASAVALLDRMPEWRRVYADTIAVVHARTVQ
jgi:hypothetical protein